MRVHLRYITPLVVAGVIFSASPAAAADSSPPPPSPGGSQERAEQSVSAWETNTPALTTSSSPNVVTAWAASGRTWSTRTNLYRGSWLMWAYEHVDFTSNESQVLWSSGFQESGAVFPNNVTRHGTSRISNLGWKHVWRGSYTVGAGAPTPWGNINVYNATSTATTNVWRGNGSSASWTG